MSDEKHNAESHDSGHDHNDNFKLFGREFPLPVYTGVFIILGIVTLFELALAEIIPRGGLTVPLMLILSIGKAALVVWFYMHLNKDSRIFAAALIIPVVMVLITTWFLTIVPTFAY
jgi:caa(3)-type oxidase subunit IV